MITARESGDDNSQRRSATNQAALLGLLAQIAGAQRVLEFGTLSGYSTIWFACAVGSDGQVVTFELEEANAAIARENFTRSGVARSGGRPRVRGPANWSWFAGRSGVPAAVGPGLGEQASDDGGLGQGDEGLNDPGASLGADAECFEAPVCQELARSIPAMTHRRPAWSGEPSRLSLDFTW